MPLGSLQDAATTAVLFGEGRVAPAGGRHGGKRGARYSWQQCRRGRSHHLCGEVGRKAECGKSARSV